MVTRVTHSVRPGGLSDADRDTIGEMAERGCTPGQISRAIQKHPGTVLWFMYSAGLKGRGKLSVRPPYVRKGVLIRPFTQDEDAFIQAKSVEGLSYAAIAAAASAEFGFARRKHSVRIRLIMLAGFEEAEAELAPPPRRPNCAAWARSCCREVLMQSFSPPATESVKEKADRYFSEQCRRLGPIASGSITVGCAPPLTSSLEEVAAAKLPVSRARARERAV